MISLIPHVGKAVQCQFVPLFLKWDVTIDVSFAMGIRISRIQSRVWNPIFLARYDLVIR